MRVCPVVLRSGEEVFWCWLCGLHADYAGLLVSLTSSLFLLCVSFRQFVTASVSPAAGSTAGRTMWGSACSRGWSRTASRTKWCTKAPHWTRQTDLKQRSRRGLPDTGSRPLCPYRDLKRWLRCVMLFCFVLFLSEHQTIWIHQNSIVINQSLITG